MENNTVIIHHSLNNQLSYEELYQYTNDVKELITEPYIEFGEWLEFCSDISMSKYEIIWEG